MSAAGVPEGHARDFGELLLSGDFNDDNIRKFPLTICVKWLRLRDDEVRLWKEDFNRNRGKLNKALADMRASLEKMFDRVTWLCSGRQCYLSAALREVPKEAEDYYDEFTHFYNAACDELDEYVAYAHHYETKYQQGERPDTQSPHTRKPAEIRAELLASLDSIKETMGNLAASLERSSKHLPGPGPDFPSQSQSRSA
jgi:hypothetical protein